MKTLMTNYYLGELSGSETATYTVAKELRNRGHEVRLMCGSYMQDGIGHDELKGFPLIDTLAGSYKTWVDHWQPDIIHAQQNPTAMAARDICPETPMVYVCHSIHDRLERPPRTYNMTRWLACSQEVSDWMTSSFPWIENAEVIGQPIDTERFMPTRRIRFRPAQALIVSARMEHAKEDLIKRACVAAGMSVTAVGGRNGCVSQDQLAERMNDADIVFSMGRGVYEAMACGRIPIIYDCWGGDGMVTAEYVDELAKKNFSGRTYHNDLADDLGDIIQCYDHEEGARLRKWVVQRHAVGKVVDRLEEIYHDVL